MAGASGAAPATKGKKPPLPPEQAALLAALERVPIVRYAAEKAGVARATYYLWRKSAAFASAADASMRRGRESISDLAKSKLISMIDGGNLGAVIFWLKSRDPEFGPRVTVRMEASKHREEPLSPEQVSELERSCANIGLRVAFKGEDAARIPPPLELPPGEAERFGKVLMGEARKGIAEMDREARARFRAAEEEARMKGG